MHAFNKIALIGVFVLCAAGTSLWRVTAANADVFSNADIDGDYGYSLSGTDTDPFGRQFTVIAVGQLSAVNGVAIRHTRTFNVGGFGIVDGVLAGRAEVQSDGRGVVVFCGDNIVRPPSVLPLFPRKSLEVFEFVLTGRNSDEILFIGIRFDPLPDDFDIANCPTPSQLIPGPPSGAGVIGVVRRQHSSSDDDDG